MMKMKVLSAAVVALCTAGAGGATTVENDTLKVNFADADSGFAVTGIVVKETGSARFITSDGKGPDFWELDFTAKAEAGGNTVLKLSNRSPAAERQAFRDGDTQAFLWKGMALGDEQGVVDVRAELKLPYGKAAGEWRIFVTNRSRKRALATTRYPYLRTVIAKGEGDALVPTKNLGARFIRGFDPAALRPGFYGYPGWYPMVTAFQKGESGLYCAAHDPDGRIKTLHYLKDGSVFFETPVENAGVVGKAAEGPKYPVVITGYSGDWWQVAHIYRNWALKQKWAAKGPIAKRSDYPRAMSDVAIWGRLTYGPSSASNTLAMIRNTWPDVKLGFRWYSWNIQPFDNSYPEFFPQPGVKEFCEEARKKGYLVMPYVNGRLWDQGLRSFRYAKRDCCTDKAGNPVIEKYGRSFGVMCPYAEGWQQTLIDMGVDVVEGNSANAIYYDQISCSRPQLCFNPAHGHTLGGGTWWAEGYRKALTEIHKRFSAAGIPVTSEGAGESWLDLVDGHLIVGRNAYTDDVPFYPAVYSGYTTYFCCEEQATDAPEAFFARQVQSALCGCQSGSWSHNRLFLRDSKGRISLEQNSRCLHALARLRTKFPEYLAYGMLRDEIRPLEPLPMVEYEYAATRTRQSKEPTKIAFPAMIGYIWTDVDGGSKAIFAANVSSEKRTVKIRVPAGLSVTAKALEVPDQPAASFTLDGGVGALTLEPFSIAMIR